jgi:hypothetical protein
MEIIGLNHAELLNLLDERIAQKAIQQPLHTADVYDWIEKTISHRIYIALEALLDVLDENNKRIAQQLSERR